MASWFSNQRLFGRFFRPQATSGALSPACEADAAEVAEATQLTVPRRQVAVADPQDVEAVRVKRIDANNLLRQLEQELLRLIEDKEVIAEQYAAAKAQGDEIKIEIVARSFMGIQQTICLKKNLYGELSELEQMLHWDENRSAFDYISRSFSIDFEQSQQMFSERIAKHAVQRRKQFELAQTVKEGEAALGKMRDAGLDEAMQELAARRT